MRSVVEELGRSAWGAATLLSTDVERDRRVAAEQLREVGSELVRVAARKNAISLMEAERARRVHADRLTEAHVELNRRVSAEAADLAADKEQARRIADDLNGIAQASSPVKAALLREISGQNCHSEAVSEQRSFFGFMQHTP